MNNWKRTFAFIWTGQFLSMLSSTMVNFAIILYLSMKTGSAEVLAYAFIAAFIPHSILGLFIGVFIDKWDRKKTMIFSDGFIALSTLGIAVILYMGVSSLWPIYLAMALRSVGSAFHMPALQASVPLLAPESELLRIAGVNQMIQSVSSIGGPALGALVYTAMDIEYVLLLDIIGAAFAIISLFFVHIPNPARTHEPEGNLVQKVWKDTKEAINAVTHHKGLNYLFLFSIIATFCVMPVAVLFPLLTLQHFNGNELQVSIIEVVWGLGMLIGGGAMGLLKLSFNKALMINTMHVLLGLSLSASGMLPSSEFIIFVALTFIGGMAMTIYNANFVTILQEKISPEMLGRVFSMFTSISLIPTTIGLLGTGFLADEVGISLTFIILGGAIAMVGIVSFFVKAIAQLGRPSNAPVL